MVAVAVLQPPWQAAPGGALHAGTARRNHQPGDAARACLRCSAAAQLPTTHLPRMLQVQQLQISEERLVSQRIAQLLQAAGARRRGRWARRPRMLAGRGALQALLCHSLEGEATNSKHQHMATHAPGRW